MSVPRVHDLVRIDAGIAAQWHGAPEWVSCSVRRAPWLVVRRESVDEAVAVGVRGETRSQRYATTVSASSILELRSPWDLDAAASPASKLRDAYLAVLRRNGAERARIAPAGSFAYEVASGKKATHDTSDLDIVIDAKGLTRASLLVLAQSIEHVRSTYGVRVDTELLYAAGGAAFGEVLAASPLVLFKTKDGPRLLACPA